MGSKKHPRDSCSICSIHLNIYLKLLSLFIYLFTYFSFIFLHLMVRPMVSAALDCAPTAVMRCHEVLQGGVVSAFCQGLSPSVPELEPRNLAPDFDQIWHVRKLGRCVSCCGAEASMVFQKQIWKSPSRPVLLLWYNGERHEISCIQCKLLSNVPILIQGSCISICTVTETF